MDPAGRIDDYQLAGVIARGAFGTVFRATDNTGREVALKLLGGRLDPRTRERFQREGQITASLDAPGIVRVFGCGETEGKPYLVYELVEGGRTLSDLLDTAERSELLRLVGDTARALGHAHRRGVVHRDVKPGNLLVDEAGDVRVADFGLAVAGDYERLTRTGELVGTPQYMAPEQVDGRKYEVTPATDVWALGAILYEALTGTPPFMGASLLELGAQVLRANPRPPSRVKDGISPALDAVCLRALQRKPQERFADGQAFADALEAALSGEGSAPLPLGVRLLAVSALATLLVAAGLWVSRAAGSTPPRPALATKPAAPATDPLQTARTALDDDRPTEALQALRSSAPSRIAARLRAEAHLSLGDVSAAREALADRPSRESARLAAFAALLAGELPLASSRLKSPADLRALEIERRRRALEVDLDDLSSLVVRVPTDRILTRAQELAAEGVAQLPPLGALARELRRRLAMTLLRATLTLVALTQLDALFPVLEGLLLQAAALHEELRPTMDVARCWVWFHQGRRANHPTVIALARERPPPLETIDPRLHGVALGMHYLTNPERRRELRPLGLRALTLDSPVGPRGLFRCDLMAGLIIDHRALAWDALKRGDPTQARRLLARPLQLSGELVLERSTVARWPASQACYTFLLAGDIGRARTFQANMTKDRSMTLFVRAEIDLVAGKTREAYEQFASMNVAFPEVLVAQAHCLLLQGGEPARINELIRKAKSSGLPRAEVDWHAPEEFEHLRAGGWWPGKR